MIRINVGYLNTKVSHGHGKVMSHVHAFEARSCYTVYNLGSDLPGPNQVSRTLELLAAGGCSDLSGFLTGAMSTPQTSGFQSLLLEKFKRVRARRQEELPARLNLDALFRLLDVHRFIGQPELPGASPRKDERFIGQQLPGASAEAHGQGAYPALPELGPGREAQSSARPRRNQRQRLPKPPALALHPSHVPCPKTPAQLHAICYMCYMAPNPLSPGPCFVYYLC